MRVEELTPVESSSVKAIGYDKAEKILTVQFLRIDKQTGTHALYDYPGISQAEYTRLLNAESIGGYLTRLINPVRKGWRRDK